ncbi:tRNA1(Val) (adenine(37)-N6)-methyltransferase [Mycoplasma sp. CSL10137]|nr:tRNA1(Val) (adenine(37)-N6)-methyltransferase [Mycoplasma sp. CSL10137]MBN4084461.1 tRNA1(Val) (adenine(37)-N6)-methyltransferase [Mycoplasma sp. CSL10166]MBU4692941.1 tRNA1(Val) (adenine(37)-N6)-methyltransferase [Mycoplasma sp. CSL7491-lung]
MKLTDALKNRNIIKNSLGFDSNLYVYQDKDMFNYSVDTILLGNFITLNQKISRTLEIGANNGALSIFVASRSSKLKIDAVEIQKEAYELAKFNIKFNNLDSQINVINEDFNIFWKDHTKNVKPKYQVIFCNPPFYSFDKTKIKKDWNEAKLIATHEVKLNLEQLFQGCSKIIEQKGYLTIVLPIERSIDAFTLMRKYNFEPKRVQYVFTRSSEKPKFALIEARFQSGWGTHFLPNLYLHADNDKLNHDYLPEIKNIYKPIKIKE